MTVSSAHLDLFHAADPRLAVTLGPESRELADRARRLSAEVFAPIAAAGTYGRVNRKLVRALGEHGILSEVFPATDRDQPQRQVSAQRLALLKEYLALECTAAEDALGLQGLGFYPIWRWGNDAQVERWYGGVVAGSTVAAYALTEPEAGSDTAAMQLTATRTADGYRLNGTKIYISNAPEADLYVVFARTSDTGRRGVTAFLVPATPPAWTVGPSN